jgi:hypothetical protein
MIDFQDDASSFMSLFRKGLDLKSCFEMTPDSCLNGFGFLIIFNFSR